MLNAIRRIKSLATFSLIALAIAACGSGQTPQPTAAPTAANVPTKVPSVAPTAVPSAPSPLPPAPTAAPTATPANTKSASFNQFSFEYDLSLATDVTSTVVPGFTDPSAAYWALHPDITLFNFVGYKSINTYHQPRIEIYVVADYEKISDGAKTTIANLKKLLVDQPANPDKNIPLLPIFNATEIFHAQVQYLKFNSGTGVRFVTQYDQAYLPVNNLEIFYTFQGITNDGKYYIAAILPVTNSALPNSDQMTPELQKQMADVEAYYKTMAQKLNDAKSQDFAPDLSLLDTLVQSIRMK